MSTTTTTALPTGLTTGTWAIDASHTEAGVHRPARRHLQGPRHRRGHRRHGHGRRRPGDHRGLRHARPVHRQHRRRQPRRPPQERRLLRRREVRPVDVRLHRGPRGRQEATSSPATSPSTASRSPSSSRPSSTAPRSTRSATRVRASRPASTISRKDFGLTWNAALEAGGVLVSRQGRHRARRLDHQGLTPRPARRRPGPLTDPAVRMLEAPVPGAPAVVEREDLQLGGDVHRPQVHVRRHPQRPRCEREDADDAGRDQLVAHVLRDGRGRRDDADGGVRRR